MVSREWIGRILACLVGACFVVSAAQAQPQSGEQADSTTFADLVQSAQQVMMADPDEARVRVGNAEAIIASLPAAEQAAARATVFWLQSEALTRLGRADEAYPVALAALEELGQQPDVGKLTGDVFTSLGRIEKVLGDHGAALNRYQSAYEIYREIGERRSESIALQSMASIYNDAQQFERAVQYFENALERYQDPALDLAAHNNMANALTQLGAYEGAARSFNTARELAQEMESGILEARILNNLANMHIEAENFDAAEGAIDQAFTLVVDDGTFEWVRFFWGVKAQIAFARGQNGEAMDLLAAALRGVDTTATNQTFMELHGRAAVIYAAGNRWDLAYEQLRAFKRLTDDRSDFTASANAALVGAQFDFAEQALEIQQLRTAGLEQALELAAAQQRLYFSIAVGIVVVLTAGVVFFVAQGRSARRLARTLSDMLYVDGATGLPTRAALERELQKHTGGGFEPTVVMGVQVLRCRQLEGALGHAAFAKLEVAAADRLRQSFENAEIYRLSAGLFGIIAPSREMEVCEVLMAGILRAFDSPVEVENSCIDVSVAAGLTQDEDSDQAIRHLNLAIDAARHEAAKMAVYNADAHADPTASLTLMSEMLQGMDDGDLSLHYQPKLNVRSGEFSAVEALCRWRHPERGFVAPDKFIPKAEETGHIKVLTEWVLRRALEDQAALLEQGVPLSFAVNISATLIDDPEFVRRTLPLIRSARGPLTLEITETAVMTSPDLALKHLAEWRDAGARISIDDYGTGQSSLAYLQLLPADELKLDRKFVSDVSQSARGRLLIKSTVDLAHNLGLELVAEGVEEEAECAVLKLLGCDWLQGYFLSRPMKAADLPAFIRSVSAPAVDGQTSVRRA